MELPLTLTIAYMYLIVEITEFKNSITQEDFLQSLAQAGQAMASSAVLMVLQSLLSGKVYVTDIGNKRVQVFAKDTTVPNAPTLLSPVNGATISNDKPAFDWTDVTDLTGVTYFYAYLWIMTMHSVHQKYLIMVLQVQDLHQQ